jgi:tetratricopeptide (TPR) repeat protein
MLPALRPENVETTMRTRRTGPGGAGSGASALRAARRLLLATCMGAALMGVVAGHAFAAAKATVLGAEMSGFGRAVFTFDALPRASVRLSNGVLILTFDQPVTVVPDKLTTELPNYVSAVRVDPDGKAMRLALIKGFRPNLMEAGEKLFLDLLPENWKGLPPSLPPDVIEDLSRRAREAEDTARRLLRKKAGEEVRELPFRVGTTPTFTRVVFDMPVVAPVELVRGEGRIELIFDANLKLDAGKLKAALPTNVSAVEVQQDAGTLRVAIELPQGADVRGFREDDTYAIDIPVPKPPPKAAAKDKKDKLAAKVDGKADGKPDAKAEAKPEGKVDAKADVPRQDHSAEGLPPEMSPSVAETAQSLPPGTPAPTPAVPVTVPLASYGRPQPAEPVPADLKIQVAAERGTVKLGLHLPTKVPLAVFERGGIVWIAAETASTFDPAQIGLVAPGLVKSVDVRRQGRLSILRLGLTRQPLVRAAATDDGWVVTLGDEVAGASEPVSLSRDSDEDGRTVVRALLPDVGSVHWVDDPEVGDKLALVTGSIRARSMLKPQSFVDFKALATAQGLAIVPTTDDLAVRSGLDDVKITREGGLSVTTAPLAVATMGPRAAPPLVVNAEDWARAQAGAVRDRGRELMRLAADAPRRSRADARLNFARFQVANRFAVEALGTLDVIQGDDPDLARDRNVLLLEGIAAAIANRPADTSKLLQSDVLRDDPEAVLWRAHADALQQRWPQALNGFRRSAALLNNYPEDLQGPIGLSYAEAAVEGRDYGLAQKVLESLDGLSRENVDRDRAALLQARVAEGQGRVEDAIAGYDKLVRQSSRPVEAEAKLRGLSLALRDRSIERNVAINELERLSVSWRGDNIEARTLGLLGRLYAEEERWRDAFAIAHKANELYPEHEVTRTLYDETGARFEALFLDGKADSIPRLDAIALYFDFKDFTPPGRRGDEMIRRLAERLVQLDLLGEAADLLQYQVDNRLGGVAKANVATRLAIIQLMNRQPAKAYQALRESRQAEMPAELRRSRSLIEARALSDLSRTDLALEMLVGESGPEIDRLKADILWQSRRWREAGEQFERIVGDRWQTPEPLDEHARADVMRAAIAFGLGDESLSLERLRAKFSAKMADSADASSFAVITSPGGARASEYRDLAKSIASADTLTEFLTEYRKRYPEAPMAPPRGVPGGPPSAENKPNANPAKPGEKAAEKPAAAVEKPAAAKQG